MSPASHLRNPALQDSYRIFNQDCELVSQLPINVIMLGNSLMMIEILLFTVFGKNLNTSMMIGFCIIFGMRCGIAFGNTMTIGNLRMLVQQKA